MEFNNEAVHSALATKLLSTWIDCDTEVLDSHTSADSHDVAPIQLP